MKEQPTRKQLQDAEVERIRNWVMLICSKIVIIIFYTIINSIGIVIIITVIFISINNIVIIIIILDVRY